VRRRYVRPDGEAKRRNPEPHFLDDVFGMTTYRFKLHPDHSGDAGRVSKPVRALGARERRGAGRRRRVAPDSPPAQAPTEHRTRLVYWVGDERETTQGDW
jgi:hypothetical protein